MQFTVNSLETPAAGPAMLSPRLDDYDLGGVLGVGTVGTIYLATPKLPPDGSGQTQRGPRVAIKKLHPTVSQDPLIKARFRREMTILERVQHPNIIGYFGGGEADGHLYYIMELVEGGTVKDLLQSSGRFAWPVVVDLARQICSALQCAHNHGVIHRDLKPGNLFLTRDAHVKLGDFGIARDLTNADLTAEGLTVGTHAYMAPEQITGDQHISGKTDLYALGCCLFEMLTGRKPFVGDNFAQLFEQHLKVPPPRVRTFAGDCPPELDEIVDQLLAKRPEDRPFNARQVQGVMLELGEKHGLGDANGYEASPKDVAAAGVTAMGRRILEKQIRSRMGESNRPEISWKRLLMIGVIICVVVIAAAMLSRSAGV